MLGRQIMREKLISFHCVERKYIILKGWIYFDIDMPSYGRNCVWKTNLRVLVVLSVTLSMTWNIKEGSGKQKENSSTLIDIVKEKRNE